MKNLLFAIRPLALDLMSTLLFVGLTALTHNPLLATAVAIAAGVGRVIYLRARRQPVAALQWMSLGLVVVFGAATLVTNDPRFMMFKPTIVYLLVGAAMLQRGWMLPYMPPAGRGLVGDHVMIGWGYAWAGLMFLSAVLNVGFALGTSLAVWSVFISVFPIVSKLLLFAVQFVSIRAVAIRAHRAQAQAGNPAEAAA
ncbi:intracellular septation protein [Phenylobacterium hankyongense]|uniref:Intracellular septation protein n=1 Tax=Phenylobacterium hankyongense TaxID=1813876 RepID=A0A328B0V8_9CAUL|nr:septation protein IspZ [Phenylobacterium hankyongense]RAK58648.1 intracellular septation protein [Phenylobacterium hankyongense]